MADSSVSNIQLSGIACAVPGQKRTIADDYPEAKPEEIEKIIKNIGIAARHVVSADQCTSDLCYAAATHLLDTLQWDRESVDVVILVTQTSDYRLPATSCILQQRLGLSAACAAFDVNLGCSGYVYGLWMMSNLLSSGAINRGLLLAGDTISRICSPKDRSTWSLFGDAGTATAMEHHNHSESMSFYLGTDGTGANHLIVPAGGCRLPSASATFERRKREDGNSRSDEDLFMNGPEIFTFALKRVPPLIKRAMLLQGWTVDDVDAFVMHQANGFILKHLSKKMKLPREKVIVALEEFGNTSSASIPLSINARLQDRIRREKMNIILAGFGVGYSWAAASLSIGPLVIPEVLIVS